MTILIDMNLFPEWVPYLQAKGFQAVHWSSLGRAAEDDEVIMAHAQKTHCIVLTQDRDFGLLLAKTRTAKPSVVQIRNARVSTALGGEAVAQALHQMWPELLSGALVTIDATKTRLRILPFPERS